MSKQEKGTFFGGAAILAAGIVIVKLIGAIYKIPLYNIIGDEGTGHFNNAYVIFGLVQMISTAGLPVALSKTISEANSQGRGNQAHRTFRVALLAFFTLGMLSFTVMFAFAEPLATWQGDSLAATAVVVLSPTCLLACALSAFRGYAQGHGNMAPTSISQIIEAVSKLVIGLSLASFLVAQGAHSEITSAGAILGVTIGALLALIYLVVEHFQYRRREGLQLTDQADSYGTILKNLLVIAVPVTIGASIVPITTWLDTAQVQNILRETMNAQPAEWYLTQAEADPVVSAYGAYQKAMAVYNLPSALMVAITASVIPAISACRAKRNYVAAGGIATSSLRIGALLAFPAGIGISVLAAPIMRLLYSDTDHSIAAPSMAILGLASIFVCTVLICNAVLQANGFVNLPIIIMGIGCAVKLGVNYVVVQQVGVIGAPVGTLACYALCTVAELALIKRVIPCAPSYRQVFAKPCIAAAAMGAAAWATYGLAEKLLLGMERFQSVTEEGVLQLSSLGNAIGTLSAIGVGAILYVILVVVLRAISKDDLALMPKGDKLAKLLRL